MIGERVEFLTGYQNEAYAETYRTFVEQIRTAEAEAAPGNTRLSEAVARYLFKLMAYKDEYEVARLYTGKAFARQVAATFKGDYTVKYHLAPPLLARRDPDTGLPRKSEYGQGITTAFSLLTKLKGLRGTAFDIFGYTLERKRERALIVEYRETINQVLEMLSGKNHALAVDIASIPEQIRGFGHVKERHLNEAKAREAELLDAYRAGKTRAPISMAAE